MDLWQKLIVEMLWHLTAIGVFIIASSIFCEVMYKRMYHNPKAQGILNFTSNFLAVTGTLVFIAAFISSALEGMRWHILLFSILTILGFIVSVRVYKGE